MDDNVFRALADASRRALLDSLFERDGQTLGELEAALPGMTRFGVMKHLRVLEAAGLVSSRKVGRERHHYLNPGPIRLIHDRWLDRFRIRAADLLDDLKTTLEADPMTSPAPDPVTTPAAARAPRFVFTTFIRATPDLVWRALTESEFTTRYWYGSTAHGEWTTGSPYEYRTGDQVAIDGVVREADRPRRLAMTFRSAWGGTSDDAPSDLTFEIDEAGPGVVRLTVIHENIAARDARISEVAEGWPYILAGLKSLLETGEPMAAPDWG